MYRFRCYPLSITLIGLCKLVDPPTRRCAPKRLKYRHLRHRRRYSPVVQPRFSLYLVTGGPRAGRHILHQEPAARCYTFAEEAKCPYLNEEREKRWHMTC